MAAISVEDAGQVVEYIYWYNRTDQIIYRHGNGSTEQYVAFYTSERVVSMVGHRSLENSMYRILFSIPIHILHDLYSILSCISFHSHICLPFLYCIPLQYLHSIPIYAFHPVIYILFHYSFPFQSLCFIIIRIYIYFIPISTFFPPPPAPIHSCRSPRPCSHICVPDQAISSHTCHCPVFSRLESGHTCTGTYACSVK